MSNPAVMLEFFPKFPSLQAACEFLFVIDRSGSMGGVFIESAKETLVLFLKSIPPGCYFNIVGFGSSYEHLFPNSVPYNQSNLDKAMKHAQELQADLGGTELLRPLQFVFDEKPLSGLPRQVFVLTDGSVSNTDACIELTKKNVHVARVFTFGIGSGASTALVNGLARAGNGSAEFIEEGERLQGKVISSLKKALQPSVSDVELKFSVPAIVKVPLAPSKIPLVLNGEKLVLDFKIIRGKRQKKIVKPAKKKQKKGDDDLEAEEFLQFSPFFPIDSGLLYLIALQTAEGSWFLNEGLASVVGRSLSDLKGFCTGGCSEVVWGTLLAIALLETRFSDQRDEWELVSMKSEMWLQGQTLPAGETVESLTEKAKNALP